MAQYVCMAFLLFALPYKPATATAQCYGKTQGKHFIIGFTQGFGVEKPFVLIASLSDQPTTVNIVSKLEVDGSPFTKYLILPPRGYQEIGIPVDFIMVGTEQSLKALDIDASNEISLYGLQSHVHTTDGFLGIALSGLGQQYVVVSAKPSRFSQFAVIGTADSTSVNVTLSASVLVDGQIYNANDVLVITVNQLESVQIQGLSSTQDLTGSIIQTDKPVAAFSGNKCTPLSGCDTTIEQLVPVVSWGKEYIYTAARCDNNNTYRIVAYFTGTTFTIPGNVEMSLEPGMFWQGSLSGAGLISSSQPILVVQQLASIADEETLNPSLIQVPAIEHYGFEFGFVTPANDPNGFFNYINIVVKTDSRLTLTLNGSPINGTNAIDSSVSDTDYTSITVELPRGGGVHFVKQTDPQSSPFMVVVYGYEAHVSYGYAAGLVLPKTCPIIKQRQPSPCRPRNPKTTPTPEL